MILLSELSRRRIRSVQKLIRVGRNEVVVVMRVDPDKGYIDLSKRRVSAEEVVKCEEQYEKGKAVDSILTQVAKKQGVPTESLYEKIAWPLHKQYGHSYDAFKLSISEPDLVFGPLSLDEQTLHDLKSTIARRLTPKPVKVRADVEVKCFSYAGIEAIRKALQAGEDASTEDVKISVRLVAPPLYVMTTTSTDKTQAIDVMEKAVESINEVITKEGGDLTVKMKVGCRIWMIGISTDFPAQGRQRDRGRRAQGAYGAVRAGQHGCCRRRRLGGGRVGWRASGVASRELPHALVHYCCLGVVGVVWLEPCGRCEWVLISDNE